jgi:hypothetical protein
MHTNDCVLWDDTIAGSSEDSSVWPIWDMRFSLQFSFIIESSGCPEIL